MKLSGRRTTRLCTYPAGLFLQPDRQQLPKVVEDICDQDELGRVEPDFSGVGEQPGTLDRNLEPLNLVQVRGVLERLA